MTEISETGCCPKFNPTPWHEKEFNWENKNFVKDKVCTFFYMPLNFGGVMKKLDKIVRANNANVPDWLCLSDHTSKWNMDVFLAVDKEIPAAQNVKLSGSFFSKVYEGPFKDTEKWFADFNATLKQKGIEPEKIYSWYTTCPKCAKHYGKNYTVLIAAKK